MRKQNGAGGASIGRTMARRRSRRQGTAGLSLAADHPCFGCAQCCKYIAIEIDAPTTMQEYDYLVWYLVHPGVSVFVDFDNSWFVKFDSRCQHLQPSGMCGIYETRPAICREFSHTDCERHLKDEPALGREVVLWTIALAWSVKDALRGERGLGDARDLPPDDVKGVME